MMMGNAEHSALTKTGPGWTVGVLGQALRWVLLPATAIGTIAGIGIVTGGVGGTAVMAALADPMAVFAARSPGARAAGALTQTKLSRAHDEERVLSNALTRPLDRFAPGAAGDTPGGAPVGDTVADAVTALPDTGGPGGPGQIVGDFLPNTGGNIVIADVGGGGGGGGGGAGGGGGGSTTPGTSVTPDSPGTPVASVPEPGTWLTLMLGFGAIGGTLRSRRRAFGSGSATRFSLPG